MRAPRPSLLVVRPGSTIRALVGLLVATLVTASCSSVAAPSSSTAGARDDPIPVVASTNVWGDIAAQIGGPRVDVRSLISDPSQDPHTYQPSGRDELAVSRAAVVIENGGGYDDVIAGMVRAAGSDPIVVTAVDVAKAAASDIPITDNEHVWYDLDAVAAVADRLAEEFTKLDSAGRSEFQGNLAELRLRLDPLRDALGRIGQHHPHAAVAVTEPLPLYLTESAGLDNVTPEAFSEAVEEGVDVTPAQLSQVLALFTDHRVDALVYNDQSTSAQTDRVHAAAEQNGIPVVPVSELLPAGEHYQDWMRATIDRLAAALDRVEQQ